MKNLFILLLLFVFGIQSCGPKIVGVAGGLSEAEYRAKGEKLSDSWTKDANRQARKQERGSKTLRTFGYITTGLGIVGGAVSAGLDDDGKAGLAYAISIASAGIGAAQLFMGSNKDVTQYVIQSRKAIQDYENMAGLEKDRYKFLTDELNRIRKETGLGNFDVD